MGFYIYINGYNTYNNLNIYNIHMLNLKKKINISNISSFSQDIKLSNILIITCLTWFKYKYISPCISILILNYVSIDNLFSNKQFISRVNSVLSWHPITRKLCISIKIYNIFLIRNKLFINKVSINNNKEKNSFNVKLF